MDKSEILLKNKVLFYQIHYRVKERTKQIKDLAS